MDIITLPTGGFSAQWQSDSGTEMQVVTLGDSGVLLGMLRPGGTWQNTPIVKPSRFGRWSTMTEFTAWMTEFLKPDEE